MLRNSTIYDECFFPWQTHKNRCSAFTAALKEPCHPVAYILHSDPAWASLMGVASLPGAVFTRLYSRGQQSACPGARGYLYRIGNTSRGGHALVSPRSSPVPLTSFAFPSFCMFVKLLMSVRDAVWSQVGRKVRRAARSGLLDSVTETQSQLDSFSLETKPWKCHNLPGVPSRLTRGQQVNCIASSPDK